MECRSGCLSGEGGNVRVMSEGMFEWFMRASSKYVGWNVREV